MIGKNKWAALPIVVSVAGCVSSGVKVTEEQATQFQKGKTTYAEVISALGAPTNSTVKSDGSRTIMYTSTHAEVRPETFIPIVGSFMAGSDSSMTNVQFSFGPDGKLTDYSSSASSMGVGTGLVSGAQ